MKVFPAFAHTAIWVTKGDIVLFDIRTSEKTTLDRIQAERVPAKSHHARHIAAYAVALDRHFTEYARQTAEFERKNKS
jgi:hypothetical protein